MPNINLTQIVVQKHFMPRNPNVDVSSEYWVAEAVKNHRERGSIGNSRMNTLIFMPNQQWIELVNGDYFEERNPPIVGGQIAVTINSDDIDRIITTRRSDDGNYEVVFDTENGDDLADVIFLCNYNGEDFEFIHFEGLGL